MKNIALVLIFLLATPAFAADLTDKPPYPPPVKLLPPPIVQKPFTQSINYHFVLTKQEVKDDDTTLLNLHFQTTLKNPIFINQSNYKLISLNENTSVKQDEKPSFSIKMTPLNKLNNRILTTVEISYKEANQFNLFMYTTVWIVANKPTNILIDEHHSIKLTMTY